MRAASSVHELAKRKGVTSAQVALAWLLCKGSDIGPIPGTKRRQYLEENVAAVDVRLTPDDMTTLDAALAPSKISGPRYVAAVAALVDR